MGAIAASAPVLAFDGLAHPVAGLPAYSPFEGVRYWQVVSHDASSAAGAAERCAAGVHATWPVLFRLAKTASGRQVLSREFRLCQPLENEDGGESLAAMLLNVWDTLAMGNFPYASNYLIYQQGADPSILLPPWPVKAACAAFAKLPLDEADTPPSTSVASATSRALREEAVSQVTGHRKQPVPDGKGARLAPARGAADPIAEEVQLLRAMAVAAGVLYNASKQSQCLQLPADVNFDGIWDWQFCTERLPQETYFPLEAETTMFWDRPYGEEKIVEHCRKKYGIEPRPNWIAATTGFGDGRRYTGSSFKAEAAPGGASNIVFSNGVLDPWRSGGVATNLSDSVLAFTVEEGAHHLDLMWSNPQDGDSVKRVRDAEVEQMRLWVRGG